MFTALTSGSGVAPTPSNQVTHKANFGNDDNYLMEGNAQGATLGKTGTSSVNHAHPINLNTNTKGSSDVHNNMHPNFGFNFFIKT